LKSDTLKLIFTYLVALTVIGGGLYILYQSRLDPPSEQLTSLYYLIAGFVGMSLQFVYGADTSTRAARQVERSYSNALPFQPPAQVATTGLPTQQPPIKPLVELKGEILKVPPAPPTE
jgi:hypothetical protein